MSGTKKVVIFIRARHVGRDETVATQMQIDRQREACQRIAQRLNTEVLEEYVELGGTDRVERRPVVRQMLAELDQTKDVAYVITYSADRLARRATDSAAIREAVMAAGAEIVYAAGSNTADSHGAAVLELLNAASLSN